MQKNLDTTVFTYLKKYWFQLALICIVLYVMSSKDFSFQFNVNSPDIENTGSPGKAQKDKGKKEKELLTANLKSGKIEKSEAGFFSKIPFIGSGTNTVKKKSELPSVDDAMVESYLKRFAHVAINERKKYGVPSSIILANALFHGYAGKRDMAIAGNNHFAITCKDGWNGTNGTYAGACYRHYENAWTSFRDHSLYITSGSYSELRQLSSTDYQAWAKALEAKQFSEFDNLAENLISLIKKYGLDQLDQK